MPENTPVRDPLELLAEEWRERLRRGETFEPDEYVERHPDLADEIRDLFPAIVMMEELKPVAGDLTGAYTGAAGLAVSTPGLERLGDFRILREVGRGGMGVVYEAEQESLGRRVALKVLPSQSLANRDQQRRFQREARATARLHHTNIVPVYGVGEAEGLHYYVMQFIQGAPLDQVLEELKRIRKAKSSASGKLNRGATPKPLAEPTTDVPPGSNQARPAEVARSLLTGAFRADSLSEVKDSGTTPPPTLTGPVIAGQTPAPLPSSSPSGSLSDSSVHLPGQTTNKSLADSGRQYYVSVARIGVQVAEALEYANSQGIVHRDIKPSNLLLDNHGTVWVTDFGLAKALADGENLTHTGDIVGTLRYMAPERFVGHADARGDIYSLGLTLYELLVQAPAFAETDRNRLVHQVTHAEPTPPRKLNPAIPRDLETIVLKCIDREPARRYQTAQALVHDLTRFVEDKPIGARRVTTAERLWRWCRRNPALASSAAIILLLLVVMAVGSSVAAVHYQDLAGQEQEARLKADAALVTAETARKSEATQREAAVAAKVAAEAAQAKEADQRQKAVAAQKDAEAAQAKEADQRQKAVAAQKLAEENFREARQVVEDLLTKVSEGRLKNLPGMQPLRRELLETALKYYQGFVDKHSDDPSLQKDLADAYGRVAAILAEVGSKKDALKIYEKAQSLRTDLVARDPRNMRLALDLVAHHRAVGNLQAQLGDSAAALASLRKALDTLLVLSPQDPNNTSNIGILGGVTVFNMPVYTANEPEILLAFASVLSDKGNVLGSVDSAGATDNLTVALAIHRKLLQDSSAPGWNKSLDHVLVSRELAREWSQIGSLFADLQMYHSAQMYQKEAKGILENLLVRFGQHPRKDDIQRDLALVEERLGYLHRMRKEWPFAIKAYENAFNIRLRRAQDNPAVPDCQSELAECYFQHGQLEWPADQPMARQRWHGKAIELQKTLVATFPDETGYARALIRQYISLARIQPKEAATQTYQSARAVAERLALRPTSATGVVGMLAPDPLAPLQGATGWHMQPLAADPRELIDMAIALAATGDDYSAFLALQWAFAAGHKDADAILATREFAELKTKPEFEAVIQQVKESAPTLPWVSDVEKAKRQAASELKDLFIYFDGTDWAPHAVAFTRTMLRDKRVVEYISENFIPVHLDRHMYTAQPPNWYQTQPLINRWGINNFGTMVLADAQGRAFWKTDKGSSEAGSWESVDEFIDSMKKQRRARVERDRLLFAAGKKTNPDEKAELLQHALDEMPVSTFGDYQDILQQLFDLDRDDRLGVRTSYFYKVVGARRAAIRQKLESRNWSKAVQELNELLEEPGLTGKVRREVYLDRGWAYLGLGQFDRAAADFARGQAVSGDKPEYALFQVYALVQLGDVPGYRKVCADLLNRYENTNTVWDAFMVGWALSMAPDTVDDWSRAIALTKRVMVFEPPTSTTLGLLWNATGLLEYRAKNWPEAEKAFREAQKHYPNWPTRNELMLALVRHRMGDMEAKALLPKVYNAVEPENLHRSGFRDVLVYQQFMGEALIAFSDFPPAKSPLVRGLRDRALIHVGQWEQALAGLNEDLEQRPDNAVFYLERARCYENLKDPARARADYDKALELKTAALEKARTTFQRSAKKRADRDALDTAYRDLVQLQQRLGRRAEALATLAPLVPLWADDGDRLYDTAREFALLIPNSDADTGKSAADLAVQTLSRVRDLRPPETERWKKDIALRPLYDRADFQALAREMTQRSKFAVAEGANLRQLDRTVDKKPLDEQPRLDRGRLLARLGKWREAIADYDILIKRNSGKPEYWLERGQCRVMLEQWDEAAVDLTKTLDIWSQQDSGIFSRARGAYMEVAMWDPLFQKAALLRPQLTELWIARGRYYILTRRWADARAEFERVLQKRSIGGEWFEYAALQLLTGDLEGYRKTCRLLKGYQAQEPNDGLRAYLLTRAAYLDPTSGIDTDLLLNVSQIGAGNPNEGYHLHMRGATFYRTGQLPAAISTLQSSNRLANWTHGHFLNWYYLAMAHHQLGHDDEARAWLARATRYTDNLAAVLPGMPVELYEMDWIEAPLLRQEAEKMLNGGKGQK
jgi:serine/threonine protein kinase/tetratricopeptide (TPR) repeat protein